MAVPIEVEVSLWQAQALCKGLNTNQFFENERQAKKLCASCPVKIECLEFALVYNYSGVWGGTTEKDRRRIPTRSIRMLREDYEESGMYNRRLKI